MGGDLELLRWGNHARFDNIAAWLEDALVGASISKAKRVGEARHTTFTQQARGNARNGEKVHDIQALKNQRG